MVNQLISFSGLKLICETKSFRTDGLKISPGIGFRISFTVGSKLQLFNKEENFQHYILKFFLIKQLTSS